MRTLRLTERVPDDCRLSPADVDFLLAAHRAHLDLTPTGKRGIYRLTPTGHVGTIVARTCRLVIRPKIPVRNLFHLLDPDGPVPVVAAHAAGPGTEILDFLAGRLAHLLTERSTAGLHRGYAERADRNPFLHGRLDVAEQLRMARGRKDQLACRYEEFTTDVPCNQVPRAAAERVLRSPLLGSAVRAALEQALRAFAGVSPSALGPEEFAAAEPDRQTEAYRPLLDLCRFLAEGLGSRSGAGAGPAFLLDMERVFERYVTTAMVRRFAEDLHREVRVQPLYHASRPLDGQPDLTLRPDVAIERGGHPVLVVDAKWKDVTAGPPATTDLYQVLAYCTGLGVRRAVLVYPGRRDRVFEYALLRAPVRVEVCSLRVTGSRAACQRSLRRFGQMLRRRAVGVPH
jgi:5-methylcytosine-specific restriction enzyme subunit McrC